MLVASFAPPPPRTVEDALTSKHASFARRSILNVKQASKKIKKEQSSASKQTLSKKKKAELKIANRKGGRGVRNPANANHANFLKDAKRRKKSKRTTKQKR